MNGGGDWNDSFFDEMANGAGVAFRIGGAFSPRVLGGHLGIRFGLAPSVLELRVWGQEKDDEGYEGQTWAHFADSELIVMVHVYIGLQGAFGRTGDDGVWRGLLLGIDYQPGIYLDSVLYGGQLQAQGFSVQATWLTLDPTHARVQPTLRVMVQPPLSSASGDYQPWMTMLLLGVAWY